MEQMAEPVGAVGASVLFGALILKLVDFFKYLWRPDPNGLLTLGGSWAVGVLAVWIASHTEWKDDIRIGTESLETLSLFSKLVLGFVATSVASLFYDAKKAVDNTDSASTPRLTKDAEDERKARIAAVLGREDVP
jgi:hypothetical protein